MDVKWFAKVLANRLPPILLSLISLDQVGIIPGREARDNVIKTLNVHHWLRVNSANGFFLSIDAEKAFDKVAWDYMFATLELMGFRHFFVQDIAIVPQFQS